MKPLARTRTVALALALGNLGCFSLQHELPPNAYFGTLPKGAKSEPGVPFEDSAHKNWLLAGLVPYTRWGSAQLLQEQPGLPAAQSVQIREIETIFSPFDVVVSIVPGAFYGYYVWAPRTIHVVGVTRPAESR